MLLNLGINLMPIFIINEEDDDRGQPWLGLMNIVEEREMKKIKGLI